MSNSLSVQSTILELTQLASSLLHMVSHGIYSSRMIVLCGINYGAYTLPLPVYTKSVVWSVDVYAHS